MSRLHLPVMAVSCVAMGLFAAEQTQLAEPVLPDTLYKYADATAPLAQHLERRILSASSVFDNTPASNKTTDAGATLGRVLFYDVRLSANNTKSCGSCHIQQFGFSDTARFSIGINGERTARHSMALANARFYGKGRFFWDERAATLEEQVLMPIQDKVEMGMSLDTLVKKLSATRYYPALFNAAFGTQEVNVERISRALAQFVRALVSSQSGVDPNPRAAGVVIQLRSAGTAGIGQGAQLFQTQCAGCHTPVAHTLDDVHNTGLDSTITDKGAGDGRFKAPSLRNIAVRAPYMHDGRFKTLAEVIEFYDTGIKNSPGLDKVLRNPDGTASKMNITAEQRAGLVAYLETFTDPAFLTAVKFSDPFRE